MFYGAVALTPKRLAILGTNGKGFFYVAGD